MNGNPKNSLKLSIIIPAYNAEETIGKCIESLLNQTICEKMSCEIIVVDDGSIDKTKYIIKKYPVRLIEIEHSGPSVARNIGYKKSLGDFVFFAEADAYYHPKHVEKLVNRLLNDPKIGTVIGFGEPWPSQSIFYKYWKQIYRLRQINYEPLGGFIFRRSDLERIGLYDPSLRGGEDVELCIRLKKLGFEIAIEPEAKMWHREAYTLNELINESFRKGLNIVNFYEKLGIKTKKLIHYSLFVLLAFSFPSILILWTLNILPFHILAIIPLLLMFLYTIPILRVKCKRQKLSEYKYYIILSPIVNTLITFCYSIGYIIGYIKSILQNSEHKFPA